MVVATGLPFETVVGFTQAQFMAVQKAARRHWEMMASVNGIQAMFGGGPVPDSTAAFEAKVKAAKARTGKQSVSLDEVI